jgi:hypothetical protein
LLSHVDSSSLDTQPERFGIVVAGALLANERAALTSDKQTFFAPPAPAAQLVGGSIAPVCRPPCPPGRL